MTYSNYGAPVTANGRTKGSAWPTAFRKRSRPQNTSTRFLTMSRSEEIYLKLSAAVLKMRAARKVARLRADENEKLPESLRQPGRSEYIHVLQELQATGQSVLDDTPEADDQPFQMQGRAGRSPVT